MPNNFFLLRAYAFSVYDWPVLIVTPVSGDAQMRPSLVVDLENENMRFLHAPPCIFSV